MVWPLFVCLMCFFTVVLCITIYSQARNKETLAIAKSNIKKHYSIVGLQEDLGSFSKVLETVSPRMFKDRGASI